MEIIDSLPYELTETELIDELKMRKIPDKVREIISNILMEVKSVARPKAVYKECYIDEIKEDRVIIEGIEFNSKILSINLRNVGRVFPHVVTAGQELDKIEIDNSDMLTSYIFDLAKELVLRNARESFEKILFGKANIEKASYMSPGSLNDWPVSEQKKLFDLLGDVKKAIGVELLETFIMKPVKTVSGVYFPTNVDFKSCMLCLRENCPGRKAPFNPEMYEEYVGKEV